MWWIIGVSVFLLICAFAFLFMLNHGADSKNKSDYFRQIDDEQQEMALSKYQKEANAKKTQGAGDRR